MTLKTKISLSERHHTFAKEKVELGQFESVSSVAAAGIEALMRDEEEREAALVSMRDTIIERMSLPKEDWIALDEDDLFEKARQRLLSE